MVKCFSCGLHAKWIVEEVVSGKVRAACREHVALALYERMSLVTEEKEDGPGMRDKKEKLDELASAYSRGDS